ncbi:hypothetical protein [Dehalogenimonas sp. 4OHTPN]|uniref:DUF7680 domain-containing protein n=1 Tax=Dehalogenimonas sp. 4OHTPN TaxID=3166643 RepID=A0AAU8GC76_9CHLR
MKDGKSFELKVLPLSDAEYALELRQRKLAGDKGDSGMPLVVSVQGMPLKAVLDQVLDTIKKNGYRANDLRASREEPFELDEEQGVRLGLLFLAIKPLKKPSRIESVSCSIRQMETEEAYYWFAKCSRGAGRGRACRAARILMAEE